MVSKIRYACPNKSARELNTVAISRPGYSKY